MSAAATDSDLSLERPPLRLVVTLCRALEKERIVYCHWKSNVALDRSARGDNDLDLLVDKADAQQFSQILSRLGFRQTLPAHEKRLPGVLDYHGYDSAGDKIVHVHAHYQLILGHDATKNYRLPIEKPYLANSAQQGLFRVPMPEYEYVVLVIRMVLKHATWDALLMRQGDLSASERRELEDLEQRIDWNLALTIVQQHLPFVGQAIFTSCVQALNPGCSLVRQIKAGQQLQSQLQAFARRSQVHDTLLKLWRRVYWPIRWRIRGKMPKYRMATGGTMIAVIGGDGAGKSTAVSSLSSWLSKDFDTLLIHMGKPSWSLTTYIVRGVLKAGKLLNPFSGKQASVHRGNNNSPALPQGHSSLLWYVCVARDRYLNYVQARRFSIRGGIVLSDRYPVSQIKLMDSPQIERLVGSKPKTQYQNFFGEREKSYYPSIRRPELTVVLRVNPQVAVQRKTDEDARSVFTRSSEIWELDWSDSGVHVIDASQNKDQVLAELKALAWSTL